MNKQYILFLFIVFICTSLCTQMLEGPGPIHNNTQPIWDGEPRTLKTVKNGILMEIGDPNLNNTMKLIHVYGDMYEMGQAQGKLLGDELANFLKEVWAYLESEAMDEIPKWVPEWLALDIVNYGAEIALDLTYLATYKYTTKAYYVEMKAMTDAIGQPELFPVARRVHMIGELTKGSCSMFGAWGKATKDSQTIQLRALDWDFDGPFRKYPAVIVYHPSDPRIGNTFANM